jgi:hypothetical protein
MIISSLLIQKDDLKIIFFCAYFFAYRCIIVILDIVLVVNYVIMKVNDFLNLPILIEQDED